MFIVLYYFFQRDKYQYYFKQTNKLAKLRLTFSSRVAKFPSQSRDISDSHNQSELQRAPQTANCKCNLENYSAYPSASSSSVHVVSTYREVTRV